jgi:hypothetical protein
MTPAEVVLARLERVKRNGTGWDAACPAHHDRDPSLSVGVGDEERVLLHCHAGCSTAEILEALGLRESDLFSSNGHKAERAIVSRYDYLDAEAHLVYQVVRFAPKEFRQRRPDGRGGWIWNLKGVERVLYRLPDVRTAVAAGGRVYVTEGEKDADAAAALGETATTNPGGAGKWRDEYSDALRGASEILVVADNDEAGIRHAQQVEQSIRSRLGADTPVRVVLPRTGKDLSDHLAAGHSVDELVPLAREDPDPAHSWAPLDLLARASNPPTPPTILGLFYPGRRHVLSAEPEHLKSWVLLIACVEELIAGRAVLYVDLEMGPRETLARLRAMGATDDAIRDHFIYIEPTEPLTDPTPLADIDQLLADRKPTLVVIDAMTGALRLHSLDPNKSIDIDGFYRHVIDPLRAHGAAIVTLDHLPKDSTNRGRFAIGSERKIGAADVHLGCELVQPFGRGKTGRVKLVTHKDRSGYLPRPKCAEIELVSNQETGGITWTVQPFAPEPETTFRPTFLMERVSVYLEACATPQSRNDIEKSVRGKAAYIRVAMDTLVAEGHATEDRDGQTRFLTLSRPFRDTETSTSSRSSQVVPTSSRTTLETTSSPRPPLQGGRGRGTTPKDDPQHPNLVPQDEIERLANLARRHQGDNT